MYLGKIVELTDKESLFANPQHPYTEALLAAVPVPDPKFKNNRVILAAMYRARSIRPSGCRFHTRCPYAFERCRIEEPLMKQVRPDTGPHVICAKPPDRIYAACGGRPIGLSSAMNFAHARMRGSEQRGPMTDSDRQPRACHAGRYRRSRQRNEGHDKGRRKPRRVVVELPSANLGRMVFIDRKRRHWHGRREQQVVLIEEASQLTPDLGPLALGDCDVAARQLQAGLDSCQPGSGRIHAGDRADPCIAPPSTRRAGY